MTRRDRRYHRAGYVKGFFAALFVAFFVTALIWAAEEAPTPRSDPGPTPQVEIRP